MKKIALLADGWRRYVIYSWVEGIMGGSKELGLDVCLYFYNTNGTWSQDSKFNKGEYALNDLPDLNSFDGVVFDCTNTTNLDEIQYMVRKLQSVNVPVVSIGYKVDGFYYVGNDNKRLFRKVMDHMYYAHGCKSFVFAGGPPYHYENRMRFEAFKEALSDYGIPLTADMYMFGDFDYQTGVRYMSNWHESKKPLPDVFLCANDNIAAGLCATAEVLGYKVPQDFKVTGFDNLDKAAYFNPQITTVDNNRGNIGRNALEQCMDIILHTEDLAEDLWEWSEPILKQIIEKMHGSLYNKASFAAYKMGDFLFAEILSNKYDELMSPLG